VEPSVEPRWGSEVVDARAKSLPALKVRYLAEHTPDRGKLLEVGSGEGKLLRTLASLKPDLELFGCDIRTPATDPDVYAFHLMQSTIPFDDASFDRVIAFDVIEHVPSPEATLAEIRRVLKPEGRFVAFVPIEGESLSAYELFRVLLGRDIYAQTKEHIQSFTHAGFEALLSRHFEIVDRRYAYHALGQLMDAAFFAAARLGSIKQFWWKDNVYYHGNDGMAKQSSRAMNRMLELGNLVAWAESTVMSHSRFAAAGILLEAELRDD
jgi:SAM-dependent methyltransferase